MSNQGSPLGVIASPGPAPPAPPPVPPLPLPNLTTNPPPGWPPAAQWAAALLLVLALGLVGWHAALSHRSGARPTALERGAPLVDVNSASAVELRHLPGVGEKLALRIVAERRVRPFRDVDDLRRVKGIG